VSDKVKNTQSNHPIRQQHVSLQLGGHLLNVLCLKHTEAVSLDGVLKHILMLFQQADCTKEATAQSGRAHVCHWVGGHVVAPQHAKLVLTSP
jgi:hypothetical protein